MSEEKTAQRIHALRTAQHLTLEQVAAVGVGKSTVRKWETGMIANMRQDKIAALSKALHTSPAYLMGWTDDPCLSPMAGGLPKPEIRKVPLLDAGASTGEEAPFLYVEASVNIDADFCLRCRDDSMTGSRIFLGDIVFIRSQPAVSNGEIAAVLIGSEAVLKRVFSYPDKRRLILQADNPAYPSLLYTDAEMDGIRILGKAVAFQSILP